MDLCCQLGGREIDTLNSLLKGGTSEASLMPWKRQEHRTCLLHMLGPSFVTQGQLGRWTCSHGDCMSHLNLGPVMGKNLLSSATPSHPKRLSSELWPIGPALSKSKIALTSEDKTPFSTVTERRHKNKSFTSQITKNTDQQIPYLLNIGFWSFCSGEGSQRKIIPGHSQKRQRRQSTPLRLAGLTKEEEALPLL